MGVTPIGAHRLPRGAHRLVVRKEGYATVDTVARLEGRGASIFSFPLDRASDDREPAADRALESAGASSAGPFREEGRVEEPNASRRVSSGSAEVPPGRASSGKGRDSSPPETKFEKIGEKGTLRLRSQPSEAVAVLDGMAVGRTPQSIEVAAGTHEVVFRRDGYEERRTQVTVSPARETTARAKLQQLGRLEVLAEPWGAIYVDGELHAREADVRYVTPLPSGEHTLRVEHPTLGSWQKSVELEAGKVRSLVVDLNEVGSKMGRLEVRVKPWGTIYIDGELHAREADVRSVARLPAGTHTVRIEHPVLGYWQEPVEVKAGEARSVMINLNAERPTP